MNLRPGEAGIFHAVPGVVLQVDGQVAPGGVAVITMIAAGVLWPLARFLIITAGPTTTKPREIIETG